MKHRDEQDLAGLSEEQATKLRQAAASEARVVVARYWQVYLREQLEEVVAKWIDGMTPGKEDMAPEQSEPCATRKLHTATEPEAGEPPTASPAAQLEVAATPRIHGPSGLDIPMLQILSDHLDQMLDLVGSASRNVLKLASGMIDERAKSALQDFYNLYLKGTDLEESSSQINAGVDDLVADLSLTLAKRGDVTVEDAVESELGEASRLSLTAIQRRLEVIIRLDAGIKDKLIPVLHSMQFEDALNQRVTHVRHMWESIIDRQLGTGETGTAELAQRLQENARLCSSLVETADYYRHVLGSEPPEAPAEQKGDKGSMLDFLF